MIEPQLALSLGTALVAGAAAWGSAKQALNGTRERVKRIDNELVKHIRDDESVQRELLQRAAALEAKIDIVLKRLDSQ
jgi:alkylation response protein AidB-like acyl-CoA dehydrogenase